jgi:N-acyl homoserine lactone hydrolase
MKIHAIQTGTVAITTKWREGAGHGQLRLVNTLLDREWTEPLPIYAFAIEHPEGVIVIDTGETARVSEPGYFPRWQPFFRFAVREQVQPEQEIGPQLEQLGILPSDVRRVVMTHLHTDHAGGLHHFPDNEILVSRAELDYAAGLGGRIRGYPNKRWPSWFRPILIDLPPVSFGPFPASMALTEASDITLVPVPGHSPGQLAVVVEDGDHAVFLAGDSSYTEDALLRGVVDGVGPDEAAERLTHERIRAYAAETPTVYLPAHDPGTATRLAERQPIEAPREQVTP